MLFIVSSSNSAGTSVAVTARMLVISGVGDTGVGARREAARRRARIVLHATQAMSVMNKAISGITTASVRVHLETPGAAGVVVVLEPLEAERVSKRLSGGVGASIGWIFIAWVVSSAVWSDKNSERNGRTVVGR
jgi:hypothetical protein